MKKTIAILLILVIGMVGVFAANDITDKTMNINVAVDLINDMVVSKTSSANWTSSATVDTEITSNEETPVGFIHTRSNNYKGYTVWMTPGPLANTNTADFGNSYLQYTAKTYESGNTSPTGTSTTGATPEVEADPDEGISYAPAGIAGSANGPKVQIIDSGNLAGLTEIYRELQVVIPTLNLALAGSYEATITFEYVAK